MFNLRKLTLIMSGQDFSRLGLRDQLQKKNASQTRLEEYTGFIIYSYIFKIRIYFTTEA